MVLLRSLLLCSLPIIIVAAESAAPDKFQLYGYGDSHGGNPLFFADGYVYIGDIGQSNSTDAAVVTFTPGPADVLTSFPSNKTSGSTPSWSNVLLTIPEANSTDKRVRFTTADNATQNTTTGFVFHGATTMHRSGAGGLESAFTALTVGNGVSALYWNDSSEGQEPVVLRSKKPSMPQN